MADNFQTNAGSGGSVFASDDVGGVHYPYVKLAFGANDTATILSGANPLPVNGTAQVSGTVNVAGTVPVSLSGAIPAGTNSIGTVGISSLPALPAGTNFLGTVAVSSIPSIPAGTNSIGTVGVSVLPSLPAGSNLIGKAELSTGTAVIGKVDINSSIPAGTNSIGTVGVSSLPSLPAGSNAIGKLAANSGVNIGAVDVLTLPSLPAGSNAIGTVGVSSLPSLPAGTNAIGTVGVSSLPALPAGTNAIGTVGVSVLPALAAGANTIGKVDLNAGANIIGKVGIDQTTPGVTNAIYVSGGTSTVNVNGTATVASISQPARSKTGDSITAALDTASIQNGTTSLTPKYAKGSVAASQTDAAVIAAVTSKKLRVLGYSMMANGAVTGTLNSKPAGAGSAISMSHPFPANGGISAPFNPVGHFETVAGEGLSLTTTSGGTVFYQLTYVEV